jgi:hypothetical protein
LTSRAAQGDLRFGTPQWSFAANWVWGNTPLVRLDPKTCGSKCLYRAAPEAAIDIMIDLTPPAIEGPPVPPESAAVRLPNGTVLDYEPIHYDSVLVAPAMFE